MSRRNTLKRICLIPHLSGTTGPASFQKKLGEGLGKRGIELCFHLNDQPYDAVLVIGGTRNLAGLWRARRNGIPIVQRLNGMNWIHRQRRTGLRHFLRAEYGNLILRSIRERFSDQIIYQSNFARHWWDQERGAAPIPAHVIYNGVDLATYHPDGPNERPIDRKRLLIVEGNLMGGYEIGLEHAVALGNQIKKDKQIAIELMIVGRVPSATKARAAQAAAVPLQWEGSVPRPRIPEIDRSAHLLFSADLNAACPNTVIEALACGLPVISFDTGALPELVTLNSGQVVPYGGDPWHLEPPDIKALADAAETVLKDQPSFRAGARARAEAEFSLDKMVDGYVEVLNNSSR
jgi:glycosyltransferase involved in cell wall biosynthesis